MYSFELTLTAISEDDGPSKNADVRGFRVSFDLPTA